MAPRPPADVEEVEACAARLGVTAERILEECARLAFSSIDRLVEWDDAGILKPRNPADIDPADLAAIAEIVASASSGRIYRIKLHDKKPVLDALARYLGLLKTGPHEEEQLDEAEDPREFLIREVDRLAAEMGEAPDPPEADQ